MTTWFNATDYGLVGDGSTPDDAALDTLANATVPTTGGTILFPPGTYRMSTSITLPYNVTIVMLAGSGFSVDNGVSLVIEGPFQASLHQCFAGAGIVRFGSYVDTINAEWWTTNVTPGVTDMASALNKAIASVAENRGVTIPIRGYAIGDTVLVNRRPVNLKGRGWGGPTNGGGGSYLKWIGAGPIAAGAFVVGHSYTINSVGSTDFTLIGAPSNAVGVSFIATGVGAGTGTARVPMVQVRDSQGAFLDNFRFIGKYTIINAGQFIAGRKYTIEVVGTTNWVAIGAASNTVGVIFTATGVGSGTGTALAHDSRPSAGLSHYDANTGNPNDFNSYRRLWFGQAPWDPDAYNAQLDVGVHVDGNGVGNDSNSWQMIVTFGCDVGIHITGSQYLVQSFRDLFCWYSAVAAIQTKASFSGSNFFFALNAVDIWTYDANELPVIDIQSFNSESGGRMLLLDAGGALHVHGGYWQGRAGYINPDLKIIKAENGLYHQVTLEDFSLTSYSGSPPVGTPTVTMKAANSGQEARNMLRIRGGDGWSTANIDMVPGVSPANEAWIEFEHFGKIGAGNQMRIWRNHLGPGEPIDDARYDAPSKLVAPQFNTFSGSTSASNNTATTIKTLPVVSSTRVYLITAAVGGAIALQGFAIVIHSAWDADSRIAFSNLGANISISLSGVRNIQVTQTSGATQTVAWSITSL